MVAYQCQASRIGSKTEPMVASPRRRASGQGPILGRVKESLGFKATYVGFTRDPDLPFHQVHRAIGSLGGFRVESLKESWLVVSGLMRHTTAAVHRY